MTIVPDRSSVGGTPRELDTVVGMWARSVAPYRVLCQGSRMKSLRYINCRIFENASCI
jgi:hypothetical protein